MKKISQIETGGRFLYGGVEWVKLYAGDGTVAISAEPVFERAFDEDNKNDWRSSSLRRELNGAFLDALVAEGADRAAFLDWESDLTADDGMTDYGTATDKIALLSDKLYRMFRGIIPRVDARCWNRGPAARPTLATSAASIPLARWAGSTLTAATSAFARFAI